MGDVVERVPSWQWQWWLQVAGCRSKYDHVGINEKVYETDTVLDKEVTWSVFFRTLT